VINLRSRKDFNLYGTREHAGLSLVLMHYVKHIDNSANDPLNKRRELTESLFSWAG